MEQCAHAETFQGIVALLSGIEAKVKEAGDDLHEICAVRRAERYIVMYMFAADFCKRTLRHLVVTTDETDVLVNIVRDVLKKDYERRYH